MQTLYSNALLNVKQPTPPKPQTRNAPSIPGLSSLILTHMLQTEVKSKMSALKKGLEQEPAFPNGSPTGRTIMAACQIATQAGDLRPEDAHRHGGRRLTSALSQDGQHQWLNHLVSRALWIFPRQRPHLQQAHGQGRQQTQQTHQPVNTLQLSFLDTTAAFQTLVIVLYHPPTLIPANPLPGVFKRLVVH